MAIKGTIIRKFNVRKTITTTKKALATGYDKVGKEMVRDIKALLSKQTGPFGPPSVAPNPPRRRTGRLQRSITYNAPQNGTGVSIRSTTPYANAQEYGYAPNNLPARPYVAAAIKSNRAKYGKMLRATVKKLANQKAKKKRRR